MSDGVASSASASTRSAAIPASPGSRWPRTPRAPRSPTPASAGRRSTSPPAARTRRATRTRSVSVLGLTGVPFINVKNGCATGGSALTTAHAMLVAGSAEVALVVGFDKHPPGAFNPLPEDWGIGSWYGETGLMLTTQFFALKIQRYMAEHGISHSTLARVASKAFENGARNPNAWRRTAAVRGGRARLEDGQPPATQYMFCSPGEGAVALVLARGERARRSRARRSAALGRVPHAALRLLRGLQPVDPDRVRALADHRGGRGRVRAGRHRARRRRHRPAAGHRIRRRDHAPRRDRPVPGRRAGGADPERRDARSAAGCRSTPTAAAWPTASRSARPACARSTRSCCSCAARRASARCPGPPRVGFTQVYGAPGVSACTVLTT